MFSLQISIFFFFLKQKHSCRLLTQFKFAVPDCVNWLQRFIRITKGRRGGNIFFFSSFFTTCTGTCTDTHTHTHIGIDGAGEGDLAAQLGLVLRDLLSADLHLAWPGKKSAGLMRKAELKFQLTIGNYRKSYMLSQVLG